jgi:hypothetical protein
VLAVLVRLQVLAELLSPMQVVVEEAVIPQVVLELMAVEQVARNYKMVLRVL